MKTLKTLLLLFITISVVHAQQLQVVECTIRSDAPAITHYQDGNKAQALLLRHDKEGLRQMQQANQIITLPKGTRGVAVYPSTLAANWNGWVHVLLRGMPAQHVWVRKEHVQPDNRIQMPEEHD
jgi:hypothetical protein